MSDTTIIGVDPGLYTLGICVLVNGTIVEVMQEDCPRSKRTTVDSTKYQHKVMACVSRYRPNALGLEDVEPQPWRTQGKYPRGAVKLQKFVRDLSNLAQMHGVHVYLQSPNIQKNYDDAAIVAMLASFTPTASPHLIAATKHALYAEATYKLARAQGRKLNG